MENPEHPKVDPLSEFAKSRQRQRLHFELTPLAVIEWDREFRVVEWNPAAERIFGYSKVEALGRHAAGLIVPEHARIHVDRVWNELLSKRGGLRSTNANSRKDGQVIHCEWYNTPLVDEAGNVHGVASLVQDVTEQHRAETSLRESEENLRITLDSIADAVIACDAGGVVTRMNPVAEALTGWSVVDAVGRHWTDVFQTVASEEPESREARRQPEGQPGRGGPRQAVLRSREGQLYTIGVSEAPIRDREGQTVGMVLVFRDETAERALADQANRVQRLDAIGMLAGGVAHDFNNMLVGILGYSELLASKLDHDEDLKQHAEDITKAAEGAAELTRQLLAFASKGTTGTAAMDVHDAVLDAVGLLKRMIDPGILVETDLAAEHSVIQGDEIQIQNAILNLGVNARDAMPNGGVLRISSENHTLDEARCSASPFKLAPGRFLRLSVHDNGSGIPKQEQEHVFDPFYTTKGVGKGTGLGLAAVYGTITGHEGAVAVESEPGRGTLFTVDLPTSDAPIATAGDSSRAIPHGAGSILIVDDQPVVRATASALVENLGYASLLAVDGVDGLRVYREHRSEIDIVMLDIVMPRMNGQDCLRELRRIEPRQRILLCSGYPSCDGVSELLGDGLTGYLKKPFTLRELGLALSSLRKLPG